MQPVFRASANCRIPRSTHSACNIRQAWIRRFCLGFQDAEFACHICDVHCPCFPSNRESSLVWLADSVLFPLASLIELLFVGISCRILSGYPCGKLSLLHSFFVVFFDASEFSEARCYPFSLLSECSFWVSGQTESTLPTYSTAPSSSTIWASFAVSQFLFMTLIQGWLSENKHLKNSNKNMRMLHGFNTLYFSKLTAVGVLDFFPESATGTLRVFQSKVSWTRGSRFLFSEDFKCDWLACVRKVTARRDRIECLVLGSFVWCTLFHDFSDILEHLGWYWKYFSASGAGNCLAEQNTWAAEYTEWPEHPTNTRQQQHLRHVPSVKFYFFSMSNFPWFLLKCSIKSNTVWKGEFWQ